MTDIAKPGAGISAFWWIFLLLPCDFYPPLFCDNYPTLCRSKVSFSKERAPKPEALSYFLPTPSFQVFSKFFISSGIGASTLSEHLHHKIRKHFSSSLVGGYQSFPLPSFLHFHIHIFFLGLHLS